jgi:hypothetical protein
MPFNNNPAGFGTMKKKDEGLFFRQQRDKIAQQSSRMESLADRMGNLSEFRGSLLQNAVAAAPSRSDMYGMAAARGGGANAMRIGERSFGLARAQAVGQANSAYTQGLAGLMNARAGIMESAGNMRLGGMAQENQRYQFNKEMKMRRGENAMGFVNNAISTAANFIPGSKKTT